MKKQNLLILIISIILALSLTACSGSDADSSSTENDKKVATAEATDAAISDAAVTEATEEAVDTKDEKKSSEDSSDETKEKTAKKESSDKSSTKTKTSTKTKKKEDSKKSDENSLTIKSGSDKKVFTESDLKALGVSSYTYSYRNKDSSSRQFVTVKGIKLKSLIDKSGYSGDKVRITSKDGYTKEYSLSDLYTNKSAFKKTYGSSANSVPAVITVGESDSFKLCFGQRADDDDDNGDFNAQFWAKWIVSITVL